MKKLICAKDIEALIEKGESVLYVDCDTIITPSAKDAASSHGVEISEQKQDSCSTAPAGCTDGIDSDFIYNALKSMMAKGMLQGIFDQGRNCQEPYKAERHCCGFKLVRGNTAKMEVLDTGNPADKVFYQELIGSTDRSPINAGFMTIERCNFDWSVDCDEIYYIVDGTLTITIDGQAFTARTGDSLYAPKGSKVTWGSPNRVKVFYATC